MQAPGPANTIGLAKDIMVRKLITLTDRTDLFDAVARLLKWNLTGASVLDEGRHFLGVFSEKCCMRILLAAAQASGKENAKRRIPIAKQVMSKRLLTLRPDMDVFEAIKLLLKHRVSGAPVIDERGRFLGSFSEKTSMNVLLGAAYDQLPTSQVEAFMDRDQNRIIDETDDVLSIAQTFLDTPFRRLPVVRDGKVLGQVSRRDVLRAAVRVSSDPSHRQAGLSAWLISEGIEPVTRTNELSGFVDTAAKTITEDVDWLGIARIFQQTPYRRLPVLSGRKLVGQISRRDLLNTINSRIEVSPHRKRSLLYLSAVVAPTDFQLE